MKKKLEQGQPRSVARERHSSSESSSDNFPIKSTNFPGLSRGGTQKDEPGTKGSQSGVDFWTMILCTKLSSFLIMEASDSPSNDDNEEVESRSTSISWGSPDRVERALLVRSSEIGAPSSLDRTKALLDRTRAIKNWVYENLRVRDKKEENL